MEEAGKVTQLRTSHPRWLERSSEAKRVSNTSNRNYFLEETRLSTAEEQTGMKKEVVGLIRVLYSN